MYGNLGDGERPGCVLTVRRWRRLHELSLSLSLSAAKVNEKVAAMGKAVSRFMEDVPSPLCLHCGSWRRLL